MRRMSSLFFVFLLVGKDTEAIGSSRRASLPVSQPSSRNGTFKFIFFLILFFSCLESFTSVFLPCHFCHLYTLVGLFIYSFIFEYLTSVLSART